MYLEKGDIKRIALTFSIIFICIAAIVIGIWGKRGFPMTTHKIDYQMYGFYVEPDGTVGSSVDFTIEGRVLTNIKKTNFLQLEFQMPVSFPYSLNGAIVQPEGFENCFIDQGGEYFSYWVTADYAYNKYTNDTDFLAFALCPVKKYFMLRFPDEPGKYLLASADPNTTAQEILDYFQKYIDMFQNNSN